MKLKRMWPGICILVVFIIFDVVMVASSSFFSGLFPSDNMTLSYSCILTALGILVMSVLTFLLGRICDHIEIGEHADTIGVRVTYVLMLIAIFIGGIFYRLDTLGHTTMSPSGKLSLFENAQVGSTLLNSEYDMLSVVYSSNLRCILYFTGNNIAVAYFFQIALFMIFVLLGAATCRLLLGKAASVVFAVYVSYMPIFTESLLKARLCTDDLFLTMFGIELLVIAIYLKNASECKYRSKWNIIWFLFVGIIVGFMTYVDAGTIITVLPLLLAAMFMAGDEKHTGVVSFIFVLLGGLLTFFAMIAQEAGIMQMGAVLRNWSGYYFHNLNTFSMFWTYTNYKMVYLITFIAMSGVLVGHFRNRNFGRVSPWLLSTILAFLATPFFGATRMNDQIVMTVFFAFVLACVVSLITLTRAEEVFVPKNFAEEKSDLQKRAESMVVGTTVIEPDSKVEDTEKDSYYFDDDSPEDDYKEKPISEPVLVAAFAANESEQESNEVKEEEQNQAPRYVPEGMVLPTGSEEEMDIDKSKMRMPKLEGTIGLNRKNNEPKKTERQVVFRKRTEYKTAHVEREKDDFDLPLKSGDDFDIK